MRMLVGGGGTTMLRASDLWGGVAGVGTPHLTGLWVAWGSAGAEDASITSIRVVPSGRFSRGFGICSAVQAPWRPCLRGGFCSVGVCVP